MLATARVIDIGSPDGTADPTPDPLVVSRAVGGDPKIGCGEREPCSICNYQRGDARVVGVENHGERTPRADERGTNIRNLLEAGGLPFYSSRCESEQPMSDSALERPHLAIVTDDLSLSHFLTEGLLYEGFWTSAIGSGLQFLEVLRLRSFDAVLLDAGIGDISAEEVIRRMRGTSDRVDAGSPRS